MTARIEKTFTISETAKILDMEQGRLREWVAGGFVTPAYPSGGQGRSHRFSKNDLYKVKLFQRLVEAGFTRNDAMSHVRHFNFRSIGTKGRRLYCFKFSRDVAGNILESITGDGFFVEDDNTAHIAMADTDMVAIVMNIGAIIKEIDEKLAL